MNAFWPACWRPALQLISTGKLTVNDERHVDPDFVVTLVLLRAAPHDLQQAEYFSQRLSASTQTEHSKVCEERSRNTMADSSAQQSASARHVESLQCHLLEEADAQDGPHDNEGGHEEVEGDGGVGVAPQERRQAAKADEDHDLHGSDGQGLSCTSTTHILHLQPDSIWKNMRVNTSNRKSDEAVCRSLQWDTHCGTVVPPHQ
jgi:hypothetical protein